MADTKHMKYAKGLILILWLAACVAFSGEILTPALSGAQESESRDDQDKWYSGGENEDSWFVNTFGYSSPREYYEENEVLGYYAEESVSDEDDAPEREFGVGENPFDYYTEEWNRQDGEWEKWYE